MSLIRNLMISFTPYQSNHDFFHLPPNSSAPLLEIMMAPNVRAAPSYNNNELPLSNNDFSSQSLIHTLTHSASTYGHPGKAIDHYLTWTKGILITIPRLRNLQIRLSLGGKYLSWVTRQHDQTYQKYSPRAGHSGYSRDTSWPTPCHDSSFWHSRETSWWKPS